MGGSSRGHSGRRRIADFLSEESESDAASSSSSAAAAVAAVAFAGRRMLSAFLADADDDSNLVEVTVELDPDSMVLRSVVPTFVAARSTSSGSASSCRSLSRSSSIASRIRRTFPWTTHSPSPRASSVTEDDIEAAAAIAAVTAAAAAATPAADRLARRAQARLARNRSGAQRALGGLRFISRSSAGFDLWRRVEERFFALTRDGFLHRDDFAECIGMADSKEFAVGIFDALARRKHQNLERINKEELRDFWLQISDQSFDARLQIFFDMADTNVDGRITREEVRELIVLSASANKLSRLKEQAAEYAALIMEELDPENLGYIELWQLEGLLLQRDRYTGYSRPLSTTSGGASAGWSQGLAGAGGRGLRRTARRLGLAASEGWRRAWVVALWVAAMSALFCWKFVQYRRRRAAFEVMGYCLPAAKGAAETLKLNMALVLLPVCRNTLTWLRSTRARLIVPFDYNVSFHKVIAGAIVVAVLLHAGNHLACDLPRVARSSPARYALVSSYFGASQPTYRHLVTGVEGSTGIAMVALMTVSFTLATNRFRKNGARLPFPLSRLAGFNAFWYSHHLLAVVYALLVVHGYFLFLVHQWYQKTTWMYISVPLLLYLGERTLRAFRSKAHNAKILKVSLLPGHVLTIAMSKPQGFHYKSGQYLFLQCPAISPFEWHPFSITSAPGDNYLSVHIRTNGDWTQELKRLFVEHYISPPQVERASFREFLGMPQQRSLPKLLVDGPYGAPAQDYQNYDVLLLVGLGIGATPFISILRDLLNNIKMMEELLEMMTETSKSDDSTSSSSQQKRNNKKRPPPTTTSAHFYWVTREPASFDWFKGVMDEVAKMDKKGVIELHNYLTSVYEERDARTTLLAMVQSLNIAKHGIDIVSGTRVKTHFARPNWRDVFYKIASKHRRATVGVFYCGTPVLAKELKSLSLEMSNNTSTRFHFHKEYF